jgi:hypothetical protein
MQRTRSALTKAQQDAQFLQELNLERRVPALNTVTTRQQHVPDEAFMRRTAAQERLDAAYLLSSTQQEMLVPPLKHTF